MLARAKITLWNREEDGSYQAELNGWKLHVSYTPEASPGAVYGFTWKAEGPSGQKASSDGPLEEPEVAMMQAEAAAIPSKDTNEGGAG